jgi:hypothetical protein
MRIRTMTFYSPRLRKLDVPLGIHVSLEPQLCWPGRYDREYVRKQQWFLILTATDAVRHALASFMQYGTFDKFPIPKVKVGYSGSRCGMDSVLV